MCSMVIIKYQNTQKPSKKTMDSRTLLYYDHRILDQTFPSQTRIQGQGKRKQNLKEYFSKKIFQRSINNSDQQTLQHIFTTVVMALEQKKPLNFSVIFSNEMKQIKGIKLQNNSTNERSQYKLQEIQNTMFCVRELKNFFNQTGFTSEFKPFRLLAKTAEQSLYLATKIYDGSKKIISARPKSSRFHSNFQEELNILRKINHPNVVYASNLYQSSSSYYIVYSHSIQKTLRNWIIERQGLSASETTYIIQQVLKGLQYLHSKNIRHGNISLDTIYVEEGKYPKIKIGNFKSARILDEKVKNMMVSQLQERDTQASLKTQTQQKIQLSDDILALGITLLSIAKLQKFLTQKTSGSKVIKHYDSEQQCLDIIQTLPEIVSPLKQFLKSIFTENKDKVEAILHLKKELLLQQLDNMKQRKQSQNTNLQY